MSWNGAGVFNRIYSWTADKAAGIDITASRMDTDTDDITTNGFGNCLTRDGQGAATANLPMNSFRHTGVGNGIALTDYAALGQLQFGVNWTTAGGTSDALTATFTPAVALTDGQICFVRAAAANLTTTPTFAPNGLTAHTITKNGGQALAVGDIRGNLCEIGLRYNAANTRWELLNPPDVPIGGVVPYFGGSVPAGFALPTGQNLAIASFPAANVVLGTTYGSPGGGNFTMPDLRGRVMAHIDSGGSNRITVAGGNFDGTGVGNAGGGQNKTIAQANLPSVNFTNSGIATADSGHTHPILAQSIGDLGQSVTVGGTQPNTVEALGVSGSRNANTSSGTANVSITAQGSAASGGSGTALAIVQPTMVINCMMRIA